MTSPRRLYLIGFQVSSHECVQVPVHVPVPVSPQQTLLVLAFESIPSMSILVLLFVSYSLTRYILSWLYVELSL